MYLVTINWSIEGDEYLHDLHFEFDEKAPNAFDLAVEKYRDWVLKIAQIIALPSTKGSGLITLTQEGDSFFRFKMEAQ